MIRLVKFTMTSMISGKQHTMELPATAEQIEAYTSDRRPLIQDIFPDLTAEQREFLMTGITPEEWAATFPPEGEDDE